MPKVVWRQDNGESLVFDSVEEFELHVAQSSPPLFALFLNILFTIVIFLEVVLEHFKGVAPSSYRGLFYRRFGPLNATVEVLRHTIGPSDKWGISRVIHETNEPSWQRHPDLD